MPGVHVRRSRRARQSDGNRAGGARALGRRSAGRSILSNRIEYIDLFLAATRLGVIVVPVNMLYRERETDTSFADSQPKASLSRRHAAGSTDVPRLAGRRPGGRRAHQRATAAKRGLAERVTRLRRDLHLRHHGRRQGRDDHARQPRGRTRGRWSTRGESPPTIDCFSRYRSSTSTAWAMVFTAGCASGCWMRLLERFDYRRRRDDARLRPTLFFGVPTMYVRLLDYDDVGTCVGAHCGCSCAAPRPSGAGARAFGRLGHPILERYGMTETLMTLATRTTASAARARSVLPLAGRSDPHRRRQGARSVTATIGESDGEGAASRRLLAAPGGDRRRFDEVGSGPATSACDRPTGTVTLLWPRARPHHLWRLQHLPARDRRAARSILPS